jgi:hypothetical protein
VASLLLFCLAVSIPPVQAAADESANGEMMLVDRLVCGDEPSEKAHSLSSERSEVIPGALGQPARRLLPPATAHWDGGFLAFTLKVDPKQINYFTVRLWGSDQNQNRLLLYCEGKQVGYRHLGDIDALDIAHDTPRYRDRFFYNTVPLPLSMTRGRAEVRLEIHSLGEIFNYGSTFEHYQKMMQTPTRGIYSVYSHTDGFFMPPADERQGQPPLNPPRRPEPGPEALEQVKQRVNRDLANLTSSRRRIDQMQAQFLARAWNVPWTVAHQKPAAIEQIVRSVDGLYAAWRKDPKLLQTDPATWNPGWFGFGPAADAARLGIAAIRPTLDAEIDDGLGGRTPRRRAWSDLFAESRDWLRRHRRQYTNQSMIIDMNIYQSNRGLEAIDPSRALPEAAALRYLYEAIGLQPWLGSDTEQGSEKPLGDDYFQLTENGLTRELGFVGYYGEVLDWVTQIYDSTREPGQPGDEKIRAQLAKLARARAVFRYPEVDADGNRAMRLETVVGWRDTIFPGDVGYVERFGGVGATAATLDPLCIGGVQQMFADNQFFHALAETLKDHRERITMALLSVPQDYELLVAQPASKQRLPLSPGEPDFAWADEEDGVVAVKHGDEILYASLYWRANRAVNSLARVHYLTPQYERVAIVGEDVEFEPSGAEYTRPNWINFGFGNGGFPYPGGPQSALAGEKLPIAKVPSQHRFQPGQESPYAGKADFYVLRYGPYLIGMNSSREKTFELAAPAGVAQAPELISGKPLSSGAPLQIGPRRTMIFYLGRKAE